MAIPRRIGVLLPSTNQVVEPDFNSAMPEGVTVHAERLWLEGPSAPGGGDGIELMDMNADIDRAAKYVASAGVEVIAYACTSGTYRTGSIQYSREISMQIQEASGGVPAVTATEASVEALRRLDARVVSVAGPYGATLLDQGLRPILEAAGFQVASAEGEPEMQQRTHHGIIGNQDPRVIVDFVTRTASPEADAVFLPGTAWRSLEVVDELERRLEKNVVTVNQATIWMALQMIGVTTPVSGLGRLLAAMPVLAK